MTINSCLIVGCAVERVARQTHFRLFGKVWPQKSQNEKDAFVSAAVSALMSFGLLTYKLDREGVAKADRLQIYRSPPAQAMINEIDDYQYSSSINTPQSSREVQIATRRDAKLSSRV